MLPWAAGISFWWVDLFVYNRKETATQKAGKSARPSLDGTFCGNIDQIVLVGVSLSL